MTTIYLAELTGRKPPSWDAGVMRLASRPLRPFLKSDSLRPNAYFKTRLLVAPDWDRAIVAFGRAQGGSGVGRARLVLVNADHELDEYLDWGWEGGEFRIWRIEAQVHGTPPDFSTAQLMGVAVLAQPQPSYNHDRPTRIEFEVLDPLAELDDPLQPLRYAGDNALPAGYEGTPETVGGQSKADAWGRNYNVTAPMVNESTEAFNFSAEPIEAVDQAYDRGKAEDLDQDLTGATFDSTDPTTGEFNSDVSRGLAKFGSTLAERSATTFDIRGNKIGGVYVDTPSTIIKAILKERRGWSDDRLDLDAFEALEDACPWTCGLFKRAGEDLSFRQAIDQLVASVWGFRGIRRDGKFTLGVSTLPTGSTVTRLLAADIVSVERLQPIDRNNGLPPSETQVDYQKNWTVQRDGLAGEVRELPARKTWLANEFRTVVAPGSAGVLLKYPKAKPLKLTTLLIDEADASSLGTTVQGILEEEPVMLRFVVLDNARSAAIDVASAFEAAYPHFGWDEMKFRCLRINPNAPKPGLVTLEGWGA